MFSYTLFVVFCWFLLFCDIILSVRLCLLVWIIFFQLCYVCISILLSLYDFFFLEEQAVHTRKREIKTVSKAQHLLRHNHHEFHRKVFKQVPQDENRRELMNWRNIHQWNSTQKEKGFVILYQTMGMLTWKMEIINQFAMLKNPLKHISIFQEKNFPQTRIRIVISNRVVTAKL